MSEKKDGIATEDPAWVLGRIKESYQSFAYKKTKEGIVQVELNRAKKLNSQDGQFYADFIHFFKYINYEDDVRVIILTSSVKHFTVGIDLEFIQSIQEHEGELDQARKSLRFEQRLKFLQKAFEVVEKCRWPVLAGVNGYCIGAGIDLISGCDVTYCTKDAKFSIKEVDLAVVAD